MNTLLISDVGIRPKKVKGSAPGYFEGASDSWPLFDILSFQFLLETDGQPIQARKLNENGLGGFYRVGDLAIVLKSRLMALKR